MAEQRLSGILLHPTSLPGPFGIGDLGPEACRFADFLAEGRQTLWQLLPLGPTGYGYSPYQGLSAFAGNELLISPQQLVADGWLEEGELEDFPAGAGADYELAGRHKFSLLERAAERFFRRDGWEEAPLFEEFCRRQAHWLEDYALFRVLRERFAGKPWTSWPSSLARRDPSRLEEERQRCASRVLRWKFWQFLFFRQWNRLRQHCRRRGILLMGDLPIFVCHDSADVWAHPELFQLDEEGHPRVVAGVPPDYFSSTGQLWGNPIYDWQRLARQEYAWWIMRVRLTLELVDLIRLDHFRGFQAYWEVPAGRPTAQEGTWVPGPGSPFLERLIGTFGNQVFVAENLGFITAEVEQLRRRWKLPGMAVLQFAFSSDPKTSPFIPHNLREDTFVYTGTHDNDTVVGWWQSLPGEDHTLDQDQLVRERGLARLYLNSTGEEIHWDFIRLALSTVARAAVIPMQDLLGLGSEARMNVPGKGEGNWRWRLQEGQATRELARRLGELTWVYGRAP